MDIERTSMSLSSSQTMRSFQIGMMRQTMDDVEMMGAQIAQMIQAMPAAPIPQGEPGHNINITV